ncbi:MAG TPA: glycosyltransferase [Prolixibacteraceae bacterium]|jgi:hypothetical protein|nr:glycosyltransferase [Prolixibacteraceae bacterium]HOG96607.1 glycosyltransferase [Prolixibacteraceae bacterium]HQB27334.1 glycosyltransferase [Paludibacter sp.]
MQSENLIHPTIVVIAYNRPFALKRVLQSLANANYHWYSDINLIISIDGGGDKNLEVKQVANDFLWNFGRKIIITHESNLGLRNHGIFCGDLTKKYNHIIVFEEDCLVSRNFFDYSVQALKFYHEDNRIAGISLYSYNYYESFGAYFRPVSDGYDTYFMQVPSSLGQIWTKNKWLYFKEYYKSNPQISDLDKIPDKVKKWPESSWKKFFYKYMVDKDLYFVYPQIALSTNFGDAGTHFYYDTQIYQVPVEFYQINRIYNFSLFDESLNKYDAYFEIKPECLIQNGVMIDPDTCIDTFGSKQLNLFENKYVLSSKNCSECILNYDDVLVPLIQNVLYQIKGNSVHYGLHENYGELLPSARYRLNKNAQCLGFSAGQQEIISGKYYKLGYYFAKPWKIANMLKRKLFRKSVANSYDK